MLISNLKRRRLGGHRRSEGENPGEGAKKEKCESERPDEGGTEEGIHLRNAHRPRTAAAFLERSSRITLIRFGLQIFLPFSPTTVHLLNSLSPSFPRVLGFRKIYPTGAAKAVTKIVSIRAFKLRNTRQDLG